MRGGGVAFRRLDDLMAAVAASRRWANPAAAYPALAALVYLAIGLALLPQVGTFLYKDEVNYIAAAERYARGDFANAPNSYWGPLTSWLLAAALGLGAPPVLAARLVSLGVGAATLFAAQRLADAFDLPKAWQALMLAALVPALLYFALPFVSADLPLACILGFYFAEILTRRYGARRYAGALCGLLGGLAYFTKAYALPFFLLHFTLVTVVHALAATDRAVRGRVLRHYASGLAVFAVLAAAWIGVLNHKYGEITTGLTGPYNWAIVGPHAAGRPIQHIGFAAPPPTATVSIWEDPRYFYDLPQARACCLKPWSPVESREAMARVVQLVAQNLRRTASILVDISIGALAVCAAALVVLARPPPRRHGAPAPQASRPARLGLAWAFLARRLEGPRLTLALSLLTLAVYAGPYLLVYSDERYLWPLVPLILAMGLSLLRMAAASGLGWPGGWAVLAGLFALTFIPHPMNQIWTGAERRQALAVFGEALAGETLAGARIASNTDYGGGMLMAYRVGAKYYGQPAPGWSPQAVADDLRRHGVDYYLIFDGAPPPPGMALVRKVQAGDQVLSVYGVRPGRQAERAARSGRPS